jgi:anti-anti-sigma factor
VRHARLDVAGLAGVAISGLSCSTMHLTLSPDSAGRTTLTVEGEVDLAVADELIAAGRRRVVAAPAESLYLDLSAVSFMDSSALNALITIRNAASAPVVLVAPSAPVMRLLQLTALDQAFVIEASATD